MPVNKRLMVVGTIVAILLEAGDGSRAALPEVAKEEPKANATKAEPADVKEAGVPPRLLFCDSRWARQATFS